MFLKVDNGIRARMLKLSNDISWDKDCRYAISNDTWEILELGDDGKTWSPTDKDVELLFYIGEIMATNHMRTHATVDPDPINHTVDPYDTDIILLNTFRDGRKLYLYPTTAYLMNDNGKTIEQI